MVLLVSLLASSCGGTSESAELEALQGKVETLELQLASNEATTTEQPPTTTATAVPYQPSRERFEPHGHPVGTFYFNLCVDVANSFAVEILDRTESLTGATTLEEFQVLFRALEYWATDPSKGSLAQEATECEGMAPDLYRGFVSEAKAWISRCAQASSFGTSEGGESYCPKLSVDGFFAQMGLRLGDATAWIDLEYEKEAYGGGASSNYEAWASLTPYEPSLESFRDLGALGWPTFVICVGAGQEFARTVLNFAFVAEDSTPEGFQDAFSELGMWVNDLSEGTIPFHATGCEGLLPDLYRGFTSDVRTWISECSRLRSFAASVTPGALCQHPQQAMELGITENVFVSMGLRLRAASNWIEAEEESGSYGGAFGNGG
jgi:hypothetical protein|tara:strand:+ start:133 stop:1263 length:1131 start_codon:yes stop_codon:yes gene_type:complete